MPKGTEGPPVKTLSPIDAAYLAGLVDGEACIRAGFANGKIVISSFALGMIHRPTIEWVCKTIGVGRMEMAARNRGYRRAWRVLLGGHRAAALLVQLIPYMKTKKIEAELFVELMRLRATLNGGSKKRGAMRGKPGRTSKFSMAPEEHLRLISAIAAQKKIEYSESA